MLIEKTNQNRILWLFLMLVVSLFQVVCALSAVLSLEEHYFAAGACFAALLAAEWVYYFIFGVIRGKRLELEITAFLLSSLSLTVTVCVYPEKAYIQLITIIAGITIFAVMTGLLGKIRLVSALRIPVAFASVGLLGFTFLMAKVVNGAKNWLYIGPVSIQPSELVKIAFVFVGAATLERLLSARSLTWYIIFAGSCIGCLFLMYDFGTALIFFVTFLLIAFMRSGDIRTIMLVCGAAVIGSFFIFAFKPYVMERFKVYRHIWENISANGYQQTRVYIYASSGGLFGVGIGNGKLRSVFAATEDLVFGMLCEEMGILLAIAASLTYLFFMLYALKTAKTARSSFYAIAAVAAAGMMLFQAMLNIFGVTDIVPLTGVTLPFISRGGSSMLCSWGLLAFIKSADK
ncbi:MAG: FtsW/RodA/SpoVE family cell cycle protein [Oscillospiraceae bacterium]|nr:FtsW/RodA/SpoVE family cell cycle protein [Oscillospiraceae bacterium]